MWTLIWQFVVKRPWILVMIAMVAFMGVQWTQIQHQKGLVLKEQKKIVRIQENLGTCRGNVTTLEDGLELCTAEHDGYIQRLDLMGTELQGEKDMVAYWRQKYIDYECPFDEDDNVPPTEISEDMEVLDDEKSVDAVNRVNDLFKP